MLRDVLVQLLWMEAVNSKAIDATGWHGLAALQDEVAGSLQACRNAVRLQAAEPGDVEPMAPSVLAERKREAAVLAEVLDEATRHMSSPLFGHLQRLRSALASQIELLDQQPAPAGPADWWLADGFRLEKILGDLVFPTSVEFDQQGRLYVLEGGFSYPTAAAVARVLRLDAGGPVEIARDFRGPATSLTWHAGAFYIAEGGHPAQVTRLRPDGTERSVLIRDLHTGGDHFTTELVFGPDGAMYFGVGTATNSVVVGLDNLMTWGTIRPRFHDVPARDLMLRGINFQVPVPTGRPGETRTTGAFKPLGEPSRPGEIIRGELRANGVIYRANPDGSALTVYADGLRNPFGLGFDPRGRLHAIDQGTDVRGARPIANDWDPLWQIRWQGWHGWPDFASGLPVTHPRFKPEGMPAPEFLIARHPPLAGQPLARLTPHAGSGKFTFAPGGAFGYAGQMFIAQHGDLSPLTQPLPEHHGFRVVRLNPATGQAADFYVNRRPGQGIAGPERPIALRFAPDGSALYILDFGLLQTFPMTMVPKAGTGALWRVVPQVGAARG